MTHGTAHAINATAAITTDYEEELSINGWKIIAFKTDHDAAAPCGFLVLDPSGKYKICYITDTASVNYDFPGVTHWLIECNHSFDLLNKNDGLTSEIKQRIWSSHLDIVRCRNYLKSQDLSKTESIHLIHMSDSNSNKDKFVDEINHAIAVINPSTTVMV
jgi:phosphoribosyl 1,2-cyclic phosphodiesterase